MKPGPAAELIVPPVIQEVIANLDATQAALDAHTVKQALIQARNTLTNPTDAEKTGVWAEVLAFALSGNARRYSPWDTYFGPLASGTKKDGQPFYSPDIAGTPPRSCSTG